MAKPLLVRELSKVFGSVTALRGVSFEVDPGEVFGYLGPNGAGKTTTLRIALGLMRASGGEVLLFGSPATVAASRRSVGFVPGDLRLYGELTGRATLDFFARFGAGPPHLRSQVLDALALPVETLGRRVKFLSHGTRQKLGLAIAMQHDPALLLLDEPTTGLDPLVQRSFRGLVLDFARRGAAVLFSSHVLSEAEAVCDRVAILRAGELVALESIATLRARVVRRLEVRFRGAVPPQLTELPAVAGVERDGSRVVLRVQGDLNPLLRVLAASDVESMVFPEAELEDIFLAYYAAAGAPDA